MASFDVLVHRRVELAPQLRPVVGLHDRAVYALRRVDQSRTLRIGFPLVVVEPLQSSVERRVIRHCRQIVCDGNYSLACCADRNSRPSRPRENTAFHFQAIMSMTLTPTNSRRPSRNYLKFFIKKLIFKNIILVKRDTIYSYTDIVYKIAKTQRDFAKRNQTRFVFETTVGVRVKITTHVRGKAWRVQDRNRLRVTRVSSSAR